MSVIYPSKNNVYLTSGSTWTTLEETYSDIYSDWITFKEFENTMPDFNKVQDMCKEYPALDKAFENFKMIYNLVKDEYEAKHG